MTIEQQRLKKRQRALKKLGYKFTLDQIAWAKEFSKDQISFKRNHQVTVAIPFGYLNRSLDGFIFRWVDCMSFKLL